MTLAFTICSSNYLAHAKVLGDSLAESNPDCRFVIGLVDDIPSEIDFNSWMPHEVIPVTKIGIDGFDEMAQKYNIVELNTAVKPFYMEYFYQHDPAINHVIYIDPDILVLGDFAPLKRKLGEHSMIVTPHSCSYDNSEKNIRYEICMLSTGVFNLGFIATTRSQETMSFLEWWQIRLREYCLYQKKLGVFVDQLWVSLAPLYFDGVYVEKEPGYNMAYWNHFERTLSVEEGKYRVNLEYDLIFYHFSSFDPDIPDQITKRAEQLIYTFDERPDLKPIFDDYRTRLIQAGIDDVRSIPCVYDHAELVDPEPEVSLSGKDFVKSGLTKLLGVLPGPVRNYVGRAAGAVMACCKN